jgi:hypothetical protein
MAKKAGSISNELEAEKAKFWSERQYAFARSHFGSATRFKELPKDTRHEKAFIIAKKWNSVNLNEGTTNPRAQVGHEFGKLLSPGVGEYSVPSPNIMSTKTQRPAYSLGLSLKCEFYDYYVPPWRPKSPGPGPGGYMLPPAIRVADKRPSTTKITTRTEPFVRKNIRIPGPCQYPESYKQHAKIRYNRPRSAYIAPLERPQPRATMDLKNVVTIERYNVDPIKIPEVSDTPGPGSYNVEKDPRVIVKPQTLAPLTALPEQPGRF